MRHSQDTAASLTMLFSNVISKWCCVISNEIRYVLFFIQNDYVNCCSTWVLNSLAPWKKWPVSTLAQTFLHEIKSTTEKLCKYLLCCHHHIKFYRNTLVPWNLIMRRLFIFKGFMNSKKMTVVSVCKFMPKLYMERGSPDRGIWETCQLFGYNWYLFIC